jgi:hypothetical protein
MRVTTFAAVLALLAIPMLASAHGGNNDPNVVHACIGNGSMIVRIVGVSGSCRPAETPAHWDIQGPQGAPGLDGTNGTNGTNGIDGTSATRPDGPCFNNTNRYVDCGNGTVTDTVTGLIWLKDAACLGSADWTAANGAAAGLANGQCGLTDGSSTGDWRLPTADEWRATIAQAVVLGCSDEGSPSLTNDEGTACYGDGSGSSFSGVAWGFTGHWSRSSADFNPVAAFFAMLSDGVVVPSGGKVYALLVWPVRGGPR